MTSVRSAMLALAALLAGCGPLVKIGEPPITPVRLYALRAAAPGDALPASAVGATPGAVLRTVVVEAPLPAASLRTLRIPVVTGDTSLAWLKDAQWLEPPARQFQGLLLDMLSAQPGLAALDARLHSGPAQLRLAGSLDSLGVDVRNPARPVARVRYTAVLSGARGVLVATAPFDAARPVDPASPESVVRGLSEAAQEAARAAALWAAAQRPT
jgi:cholesterol transport system auxiliary component